MSRASCRRWMRVKLASCSAVGRAGAVVTNSAAAPTRPPSFRQAAKAVSTWVCNNRTGLQWGDCCKRGWRKHDMEIGPRSCTHGCMSLYTLFQVNTCVRKPECTTSARTGCHQFAFTHRLLDGRASLLVLVRGRVKPQVPKQHPRGAVRRLPPPRDACQQGILGGHGGTSCGDGVLRLETTTHEGAVQPGQQVGGLEVLGGLRHQQLGELPSSARTHTCARFN